MRTKVILLSMLVVTLAWMPLAATTSYADEHAGHEHHQVESPTKHGMNAEMILKEIHSEHQALAKIVTAKKLSDVHKTAFAIRDLANELPAQAPADKRAKVQSTVTNIGKLAFELDKSGDAGDQLATEANMKKLAGLLKMLDSYFGERQA